MHLGKGLKNTGFTFGPGSDKRESGTSMLVLELFIPRKYSITIPLHLQAAYETQLGLTWRSITKDICVPPIVLHSKWSIHVANIIIHISFQPRTIVICLTSTPTMATEASTEPAHKQDLPTILLIQGSFQIPEVYSKLVRGLAARGYPTIRPQLPTCSDTDSANFPQLSLIDNALAIRTELIHQIEYEGSTVVVVMHSYGGLVGSEAITEEVSYAKRQA